jgi:hypothetical protein
MSVWHLLLGICFGMPIMAAFDVAKRANAGIPGYILALAIALLMGAVFAWIMWASGKAIGVKIQQRSPTRREWYFRGLYLGAVVWIVVVALAAQRILSLALHVAI